MKVSLNLPDWLLVRLKERASTERRSLSNLATLLLEYAMLTGQGQGLPTTNRERLESTTDQLAAKTPGKICPDPADPAR